MSYEQRWHQHPLWPDGENWATGKLHTFWDVEQARECQRPRAFGTHLEGELHIRTLATLEDGETMEDSHFEFASEELRDLIRTMYTYHCHNCGATFTHEEYGDDWPEGDVCASCCSSGTLFDV